GPRKISSIFTKCNENGSRPKLRNTKVGGVEQLPFRIGITKVFQPLDNLLPVVIKFRVHQATYVLEHDCSWACFFNQTQCFWKEISLVILTQAMSSYGKGRTRDSTGQ